MKWAVFGFAAALALLLPVADMLGLLAEPGLTSFLAEYVMINLGLLLIPLGLLVSLLRYRLYDAEAAISTSAGYAVLTLMVGAAFAATAQATEWFFENYLGREAGALAGAVAAGLALALITPLHNRVHAWAERRFQKPLVRLRRDLPDCVGDLRETSGLEPLLDEVLERIEEGVRSVRGAVLLGGRTAASRGVGADEIAAWGALPTEAADGIDCAPGDPLFPVRIPLRIRHGAGEPVGWILLGPRPDGSLYGSDEREALEAVADPVARAVRVVLAREEREARQEARFAALERKLARALKGAPAARAEG
jgi:hypothetical protein